MNEILITEEMLRQFEALPDVEVGKHFEWTPEKETLLLKYWPVKRQVDVCRLLGVSENTARKKYRELIDKENKK